jgi:hypothetical protein
MVYAESLEKGIDRGLGVFIRKALQQSLLQVTIDETSKPAPVKIKSGAKGWTLSPYESGWRNQ